MDVTPQVINEVEFHQKMRGYDPDEVDDFLERVAVAVDELLQRVRNAEERAAAAEWRGPEPATRTREAPAPAASPLAAKGDDNESIRRTLVLAQRTADAAIKESEEQAKKILQNAQDQVQRLYAEAKEHAKKIVTDAEAEARKGTDDTRKRLVKEIMSLEETRDALRADQGILERHLDEQRLRLRSSIGALQRVLDDPGRLRASTPPDLSGATLPRREFPRDNAPDDTALKTAAGNGVRDERAPSPAPSPSPVPPIDRHKPAPRGDELGDVERPVTGRITFTPPDDDDPPAPTFAPVDSRPEKAAPDRDSGADVYLNSLREAMLEDTSASTLDPTEHRARARFGRRR
jgi:DivIVA domain-containing protein